MGYLDERRTANNVIRRELIRAKGLVKGTIFGHSEVLRRAARKLVSFLSDGEIADIDTRLPLWLTDRVLCGLFDDPLASVPSLIGVAEVVHAASSHTSEPSAATDDVALDIKPGRLRLKANKSLAYIESRKTSNSLQRVDAACSGQNFWMEGFRLPAFQRC